MCRECKRLTAAARKFAKAAGSPGCARQYAGIIVDGDNGILEISDELLRRHSRQYARRPACDARVVPLLQKKQSAARDQRSSGAGNCRRG